MGKLLKIASIKEHQSALPTLSRYICFDFAINQVKEMVIKYIATFYQPWKLFKLIPFSFTQS